ncbi:MAG: M50 family metallopeptidase [Saprospiraceae bacterium]
MLEAITGIVLIFLAIFLSRPITTLIHELGHALPALLFTQKPVIIHVGSYGNTSNSTTTKLGRLIIYFRFKITDLQMGLCRHSGNVSIWKSFIILLGGPIFSLLIAVVCVFIIQNFKDQQYLAFAIGIFLVSGLLDFFVNIIPDTDRMTMETGSSIRNDGAQLVQLYKSARHPKAYFDAMELIEQDKKEEAIQKLESCIQQGVHDLETYRLVLYLWQSQELLNKAITFHEDYYSYFKLSSADYFLIGKMYEEKDNEMKALTNYSEAVRLDYLNVDALEARGKLFTKLGYDERGKEDLSKVAMMKG